MMLNSNGLHYGKDVYKRQAQPYHVFLNVSSSEGVPVSIIEAMSFGIPCIATNVGGTVSYTHLFSLHDSIGAPTFDSSF